MTTGAVLCLSPRGWAFVAMALANHSMALEDQGKILPREVAQLMETAVSLAKTHQSSATGRHALGPEAMVCEAGLMDGERLITKHEAARYAGMSARTIERRIATGDLASVKVGRLRRVRVRDLRQWIADQEVAV